MLPTHASTSSAQVVGGQRGRDTGLCTQLVAHWLHVYDACSGEFWGWRVPWAWASGHRSLVTG